MNKIYSLLVFFLFSFFLTSAQEILLLENFNSCALPDNWDLTVTNGQDAGVDFGYPLNPQSDSISIDGTCMVIFDDDLLGGGSPSFVAELTSPVIHTQAFQTIRLTADVHFRAYGSSQFIVYIEELDGTRIPLRIYGENDGTGSRFSEANTLSLDLSFFTESESFKLVFVYDDQEMYAWWAGLDNVRVLGSGEGTTVLKEAFNDCSMPDGWTTNIQKGIDDWQFGYIDNGNSNSPSMNGSCFAFFDDDVLGNEAPFSSTDLISPWFDGSSYANFSLELDLILRPYTDYENIAILVFDGDQYQLVREFTGIVGGEQFNQYESITLDLTSYRSANMQLIFRYDDGNTWGWWTGIDNIKVTGNGEINDLCINAFPIKIGEACLPSSNESAIFSGPTEASGDRLVGSLWYEFTAPANGILAVENESNYNDYISIFSAECDALAEELSNNRDEHGFDGEISYLEVVAGQEYFLRVCGIVSQYGNYRGHNCLSIKYVDEVPIPTAEDLVSMAIPLEVNLPCVQSNNIHANMEGNSPSLNDLTRSDIWYSFNSGALVAFEIQVESDFAEIITVYNPLMEEIASQERGGTLLLENLETSTMYYVQVGGVFATLEGGACASLKPAIIDMPVADVCWEANPIVLDTEVSFTIDNQSFSGIYPKCDVFVSHDFWMSFTTSNIGKHYIQFESDFVNTLAIYEGDCDELKEVVCGQNLDLCSGDLEVLLDANTEYYLQVSSSTTNNSLGLGNASISISTEVVNESPLQLFVNPICQANGTATLNIDVQSEVAYTISGNTSTDILEDGESYIVAIIDENGCERSVQGLVDCQASACNLLTEQFLVYPSCYAAANGEILLDMSGGIGPYSFSWGHTAEDSPELNDLLAGTYELTITDFYGCFTTTEIVLEEPSVLFSEIESTDLTSYNANDGTASLDVNGGTFPYSYQWSNDATTATITDLVPGEYTVTITDHKGCSTDHSFIINNSDCSFEVQSDISPILCNGGANGSIILSLEEDYESILWSEGQEGLVINELEAGTYIVTVTLADGCEKIEEYVLTEPLPISGPSSTSEVSCYGFSDGEISVIPEGGTGKLYITWQDGNENTDRIDLPAGSYYATITDDNSCAVDISVEITEPDSLSIASQEVMDLQCHDSQDGAICVFIEGGTDPYEFTWTPTGESTSKITDLNAGQYALTVLDDHDCEFTLELEVKAPPAIEVNLESLSISNSDDGMIDISILGGTSPYSVIWYENGMEVGTDEDIANLPEGNYYAIVTDANQCTFTSEEYLLSLVSVEELAENSFSIYPNPASKSFVLEFKDVLVEDVGFQILGIDGKDFSEQAMFNKLSQSKVEVVNLQLSSGVYNVQLYSKKSGKNLASESLIIVDAVE